MFPEKKDNNILTAKSYRNKYNPCIIGKVLGIIFYLPSSVYKEDR